jgi:DeoR family fructose operon transcriptional repressor
MKVLAEERQQMILQMLKENKVVKLQEICEKSGCSESSARRDFQLLEEKNLLVRVRTAARHRPDRPHGHHPGHDRQGDTQYF